jgi:hypothetical protein
MQDYRLYCLDGAGHISLAEWIEAANDADAVRQAEWMKAGAIKCEVWQGHRLVAVLHGQHISSLPAVQAPRANRNC